MQARLLRDVRYIEPDDQGQMVCKDGHVIPKGHGVRFDPDAPPRPDGLVPFWISNMQLYFIAGEIKLPDTYEVVLW